MFIRHSFSRFIESNTNFKNQRNFSLFIHIYEHKRQLLKTMFNICSTSSNMWIWSYEHPPQDRFTCRALHFIRGTLWPPEPWLVGGRGQLPPTWTCWARHIKSLDGFVFFRLSYLLKIAFWSFQIWKFSGGGYPHTPLQGSCLRHSR